MGNFLVRSSGHRDLEAVLRTGTDNNNACRHAHGWLIGVQQQQVYSRMLHPHDSRKISSAGSLSRAWMAGPSPRILASRSLAALCPNSVMGCLTAVIEGRN